MNSPSFLPSFSLAAFVALGALAQGAFAKQPSGTFIEKPKADGVRTKSIVNPGAEHGWPSLIEEHKPIADWCAGDLQKPGAAP
jgi:hypothetical protein